MSYLSGVDVFAALADPVRRDLLGVLAAGPARVVDLAADRPISRPAVSRHLRILDEAGLVAADDRGRERHYRLLRDGLAPLHTYVETLAGPRPPVDPAAPTHSAAPIHPALLDGLDLEVRRTVHERMSADTVPTTEEIA